MLIVRSRKVTGSEKRAQCRGCVYTCGSGRLKAESTKSRNGALSDPSRFAPFSRRSLFCHPSWSTSKALSEFSS